MMACMQEEQTLPLTNVSVLASVAPVHAPLITKLSENAFCSQCSTTGNGTSDVIALIAMFHLQSKMKAIQASNDTQTDCVNYIS